MAEQIIRPGMKIAPLAPKDKRHLLQRALANVVLACCQSFLNIVVQVIVTDGNGKNWFVNSSVLINQNSIVITLPFTVAANGTDVYLNSRS
jgi:hypothetical protein